MASNGYLSTDQYLRTTKYLGALSESILSSCETLSKMVPTADTSQYFHNLLQELSQLPERIERQRCLRFELRGDIPLQSGDVLFGLPGLGRLIVLSKAEGGVLHCVSYSHQSHCQATIEISPQRQLSFPPP
jgi:hypothetical protein